jgi:hypothetical protein
MPNAARAYVEGSGTVATRKPIPESAYDGGSSTRIEDQIRYVVPAHTPPRSVLDCGTELLNKDSFHSQTLPPWSDVRYNRKLWMRT